MSDGRDGILEVPRLRFTSKIAWLFLGSIFEDERVTSVSSLFIYGAGVG